MNYPGINMSVRQDTSRMPEASNPDAKRAAARETLDILEEISVLLVSICTTG